MPIFHLGLDDTDSLKMGCTTYIAALLIEKLLKGSEFVDYPNLIRLNPNIPWKSRGNAAICLRFRSDCEGNEILETAMKYAEEYRDRDDPKNQPGIALLEAKTVPEEIKEFGNRALSEVLSIGEAKNVADMCRVKYRTIRGGRGIVGALAAIGNTLERDHTYELAVYRGKELWGKERQVVYDSVLKFDTMAKDRTFNNIDAKSKRLLVTPHGPDPILFGIRGEDPRTLLKALTIVKYEGAERWVMYRSNQGTDAHLSKRAVVSDLRPYVAAVIEGILCKEPAAIKGGHVISRLSDGFGEVDIAAYEPSSDFRMVLARLAIGDKIRAYGGVKPHRNDGPTFNLERLEILSLTKIKGRNPVCPDCGKRMKSEGKGKGYQCERCGKKMKVPTPEAIRDVCMGNYLPPPKAMRHLTKPLKRYGQEKTEWSGRVGEFYGVF